MIKIKNISSARVVIALPDIRLHRDIRPGMAMPFKDEEYEYLTFDPGFNALLDGHYIRVLNDTIEKADGHVEEKVYEATEIKEMLEKRDITAFAKFIKNATAAEREAVIKYAVELKITDNGFAALIKNYCHIDLIEAISQYHQSMGV